jgi:hypothetical protein
MPAMVRPSTVVTLLSSTIALRWRATAAGWRRVVVAADPDVRDADRRDRADVVGLGAGPSRPCRRCRPRRRCRRSAPRCGSGPRTRVQCRSETCRMRVVLACRLVHRQRRHRRVEPAHVADDLLELLGVPAVVVGYPRASPTTAGALTSRPSYAARRSSRAAACAAARPRLPRSRPGGQPAAATRRTLRKISALSSQALSTAMPRVRTPSR